MKKLLIAASALFFLTAAQAQTSQKDTTKFKKHQRGGFSHHKGTPGMKNLNLSEDQKKQMKELNESYRKQFTDLRSNKSLGTEEMKTKSQALRKEQFGKMQSLLTADQKAQIAAQRKERGGKDMHKSGKGFDRGAKGFGDMKEKLGLSEEQSTKLKTNNQAFREKTKAIRTDSKLSDEQKKEQVKALVKQQQENMKAILTPEQQEKLKAGRKHRNSSK